MGSLHSEDANVGGDIPGAVWVGLGASPTGTVRTSEGSFG
jgi:hypothetical protein